MVNNRKTLLLFAFIFFFIFGFTKNSFAQSKKAIILKGEQIVFKSGCINCHSFIKGARIDGIISLAEWGDKRLTMKQTEEDIRKCKADAYCSQILTDKQVKCVAFYLNSVKKSEVGK
ncbi:MAG: hypothetical protein ACYCUW_04360 [bacterium]